MRYPPHGRSLRVGTPGASPETTGNLSAPCRRLATKTGWISTCRSAYGSNPTSASRRVGELTFAAHDFLSPHRYRSVGDLDSRPIGVLSDESAPLVVVEIDMARSPHGRRALFFADGDGFGLEKSMILGVLGNRTRLLPPTPETMPTALRD